MSDDTKTVPTNGNGGDYRKKVAANLFKLVDELTANSKEASVQALRVDGLARVIERSTTPFGQEQAIQIADVIQEAGDIAHERGSLLYDRATKIRKAASGE